MKVLYGSALSVHAAPLHRWRRKVSCASPQENGKLTHAVLHTEIHALQFQQDLGLMFTPDKP